MSTGYRPIPAIPFVMLYDGCLEKYGIREKADPGGSTRRRCLVGSDGVLEVYEHDDGSSSFTRRSFTPLPWSVLDALTEEFGVELVSEHDHRYWGFATAEEETQFHEKMAKESNDKFYDDLIRYLRGEPHGIGPGTVGMQWAEIAKGLVAGDQSLMTQNNWQRLEEGIKVIYDRDHAVMVTLMPEDVAAVELMVAMTKKMPQA